MRDCWFTTWTSKWEASMHAGGTQTITWTFTEACDRTITPTQTIHGVEPAPPSAFINAPADITMTCEEAAVFTVSDLAYTNGEAGSCEIDGSHRTCKWQLRFMRLERKQSTGHSQMLVTRTITHTQTIHS
ncbi:MAG: hypothetical protein IPI60_06130 [Saprospiraceae bacterium]|nr:hypothetical protein [Saprospiraceae bacterium]